MQVLIVGASGYLGKHVYAHFKDGNNRVVGTYRTRRTDRLMVRFDLNRDDPECLDCFSGDEGKYAVVCAAEAGYDECEVHVEESFQTNVTSTIKLIDWLKQNGYYVVFCSTEAVYGGGKGYYRETDVAHPVNQYGRMKLEVERHITEHYPDTCIFRLAKMVGDTASPRDVLREWKEMAEAKKDICCIRDNYIAFVDVEDVARCMEIACDRKISGIYNICGNDIYRRVDLCKFFLRTLGLETGVYEKDMDEFGFMADRPLNVGMCNQKALDVLGCRFKPMEEVFIRYKNI